MSFNNKLALVLSGGGARGAYEAGIIHYIRTQLPKSKAIRPFDILCGSSVGAINASFLAATSHNLEYQGKNVYHLWTQLNQDDIYKRGMGTLTRLAGLTLSGVFSNIFSRDVDDLKKKRLYFRGFLDTSPFPVFLKKVIPWKQISLNIQNGITKALTVTGTNTSTGKMELFIEKHPSLDYSGRHLAHFTTIDARHAMASAAIPVLFPTVRVGRNYYCDGGLRLNTPLSPAVQLGADKVLVIGLHHISERAEQGAKEAFLDNDLPPTMGEVIGQVLKTIFVDRLDYDLEQLKRINNIIDWSEAIYGADYLSRVNQHLKDNNIREDIAKRGLKRLNVMSIFPSVDIRKIFSECVEGLAPMKKMMTSFEKALLKVLDVDLSHGQDFLSFILFAPTYMKKLVELGFEDAKSRHDDLISFFEE